MKIIILAAGRGSRMGKETEEIPKCMIKLNGRTLLDRCLESIEKSGFNRKNIGIVTGYKKEKINIDGVKYFHNAVWEKTNMFFSLTMADEWLKKESCIIVYSDIIFHPNALKILSENEGDLAITYYTGFWDLWNKRFENPLHDLETFKTDGKYLIEIGKKPIDKEEIQGQYMGLLKFTPNGWKSVSETISNPKALSKTVNSMDMTTLLSDMIRAGYKINTVKTDELWLECDNENDVLLYQKEFSDI